MTAEEDAHATADHHDDRRPGLAVVAGASLDDVVEVGVLLSDPDDFAGMNEEYARWFPTDPPARYAARLGARIPGLLVSIRMTAIIA